MPQAGTPLHNPEEPPHPVSGRSYDASFLQKNWQLLDGIIIRYHHKSDGGNKAKKVRNARVRVLANNAGFDVVCLTSLEKSKKWKWRPVDDIKNLVPVIAGYNNHQDLWVIVDGPDAGRYCKALSAPRLENWYRVRLAHLEDQEGITVTVIDDPPLDRQVRPWNVMVVWQKKESREREPDIYIKRNAAQVDPNGGSGSDKKRKVVDNIDIDGPDVGPSVAPSEVGRSAPSVAGGLC
jgi:hypothetical protein